MVLRVGYSKIGLLLQLRQFKDAVRACDDVQWKFRKDRAVRVATTALDVDGYRGLGERREAAQALLDKGNELVRCDRWDEAAAALDTVVARYGEDADPILKDIAARARPVAAKLRS